MFGVLMMAVCDVVIGAYEAALDRLAGRFADLDLVLITYEESIDYGVRGFTRHDKIDADELVKFVRREQNVPDSEYYRESAAKKISRLNYISEIEQIQSVRDVKGFIADSLRAYSDGIHFVGIYTRNEFVKMQREERRRKLEDAAARFAKENNVPPCSLEFIRAVRKAIKATRQRWTNANSGESRMEHWAACQYAGVGSDVFFDDVNYTNGQFASHIEKLEGILEWLHESCPLLMAQEAERRARRRRKLRGKK